jgi:hypothetical protein
MFDISRWPAKRCEQELAVFGTGTSSGPSRERTVKGAQGGRKLTCGFLWRMTGYSVIIP